MDRLGYASGAACGETAWRVLRASDREGRLGEPNLQADEGAGRSDTSHHARIAVESRCSDLHLRLHRRPRTEPADHLAPHGKAQGSRACRFGEARHLDLLPRARQARARNATGPWTTDRLADRVTPCA